MAQEYSIAAGYNNAGSLITIEAIRVSSLPLKSSVSGLGQHTAGLDRQYLDSTHEDTGTASWTWVSATMTPVELKYIMDTYMGGARSAKITARTLLDTGVYSNFNVVLSFPQTLTNVNGHYEDVIWTFEGGEAI